MQDELLNLSGHVVALINVVLDAECKTGDKDEILERLDTINTLIGGIRNAAEKKEAPAIPQQPQGEICSDNLCDYCEHFIDKPSVWCSERCTDCDNFKGRKLSPVR